MEVTEEGINVPAQLAIKRFSSVRMTALQSPLLSNFGFAGSTLIDISEVQPKKAEPPKEVTEEGMVMDFREAQPPKAPPPMEVTEEGMLTEEREVQFSNA